MKIDFSILPWHDANLQDIHINREFPGEKDIISLVIQWPNDNDFSIIEFLDCYAFMANMNFGIVACEAILTAECLCESQELNGIRQQWSNVGVDLRDLKHIKIKTNSTNSIINIFSLNFNVKKNMH